MPLVSSVSKSVLSVVSEVFVDSKVPSVDRKVVEPIVVEEFED